MNTFFQKGLKALAIIGAMVTTSQVAAAQTIRVLILQDDSDKTSLLRNGRIQSSVLNSWNQTMHGPAYQQILRQYGISGMNVYDETALTLRFYQKPRHRRPPEEIIALARQIHNPEIDALVIYTLYAKAIQDPYTHVQTLRLSMNYRALGVKDGSYLGGGNLDLDTHGVVITGCAAGLNGQHADSHCVSEFVASHAEQLARDGGNKLSLQLAALLGQKYGNRSAAQNNRDQKPSLKDNQNNIIQGTNTYNNSNSYMRHKACGNIPATYIVKYQNFSSRQINFIEGNMENWKCKMDLDTIKSSFSDVSFEYKTRSSQQRILRNIRLMTELMGLVVEAKTNGNNQIIVKSLALPN